MITKDRRKPESYGQLVARILSKTYTGKWFVWYLSFIVILAVFAQFIFFGSTTSNKFTDDIKSNDAQFTIAVLPFRSLNTVDKQSNFIDGLHSDLLVHVAKIQNFKSISRHSVMRYKDSNKNLQVVAKELGVTMLVHGSIQSVANEIRININLIDALTDANIWAETYTRKFSTKNILIIQEDLAKSIALGIESSLDKKLSSPDLNVSESRKYK